MKRPPRNFVVEYKGSRRQAAKPSSIWGDLDLETISRDMEDEAATIGRSGAIIDAIRLAGSEQNEAEELTPATAQPKTSLLSQERHMAEETDAVVSPDNVSAETTPTIPEPKKRRGPRAKNAALATETDENSGLDSSKPAENKKAERKTRVKRTKAERSGLEKTVTAKKPRASRPAQAIDASPTIAGGDELTELLQLEEENRNLRRLLGEKLRAENADLRERLGRS